MAVWFTKSDTDLYASVATNKLPVTTLYIRCTVYSSDHDLIKS